MVVSAPRRVLPEHAKQSRHSSLFGSATPNPLAGTLDHTPPLGCQLLNVSSLSARRSNVNGDRQGVLQSSQLPLVALQCTFRTGKELYIPTCLVKDPALTPTRCQGHGRDPFLQFVANFSGLPKRMSPTRPIASLRKIRTSASDTSSMGFAEVAAIAASRRSS